MDNHVKQEAPPTSTSPAGFPQPQVVDLCSSDDSDVEENANGFADRRYNSGNPIGVKRARDTWEIDRKNVKKATVDELGAVMLPERFGQSILPRDVTHAIPASPYNVSMPRPSATPSQGTSGQTGSCKQFWKAGDYEGAPGGNWDYSLVGIDHVRVHPKFLHSNATSHKWSLGAFAELLDNALDEVASGATHVNVDMLQNNKAGGNRMLLIEDNGGGMDPDKMRQCMSLGYSAKCKLANTIGQYGNGFKTSTMRLGADVIVFTRCQGKDGTSSTQSIGLLSYTFLTSTGQEDIIVPMLDYERKDSGWSKIVRSSVSDWDKNVETIVQWSPFSSEEDLLCQFNLMSDHGTRIIIYNLWEDDQGMLELDFDADPHDIQLRGVNRDEKNIKMASQFPNSRHFLTYKHSLRSYASILYLRTPPGFRIILRGRDVEHHNIVNDMMQTQQQTYKPHGADGSLKDAEISAIVTIGFVKDAGHHIDVQGFNVYHKNRLIKPFWRIWNAAGSNGRGVIGVLEANFVEPAHDKQGFERTTVLARLESRLLHMQKTYWSDNCHKIGYAAKRYKDYVNGYGRRERSPENDPDGFDPFGKKASGIRTSSRLSSSSYSTSEKDGDPVLREELRRERARSKALETELKEAKKKIEEMNKEQETLIDIFSEERDRRDGEEESLRNKLEEASNTIQELLDRIKMLEASKGPSWRR